MSNNKVTTISPLVAMEIITVVGEFAEAMQEIFENYDLPADVGQAQVDVAFEMMHFILLVNSKLEDVEL